MKTSMRLLSRTARGQSGVIIADILVATAMVIVGVFGTFFALEQGMRAARACHHRQTALEVLQSEMEAVRATPFEELHLRTRASFIGKPAGPDTLRGAKTWLTVEDYSHEAPGLRKVTAGIEWTTGSKPRSASLVTIVGDIRR